jgi:phosphoribosyl-AMP cyclohydrolase
MNGYNVRLFSLGNNVKNIVDNSFYKHLESLEKGQAVPRAEALGQLRFDSEGLIPAIAQQYDTGEVLMMAWMNKASIAETLATGHVCYWSRSRQSFWRKGESSGNVQMLIEMRIDCDGDTLLCKVDQTGPACHTDRTNCFYLRVDEACLSVVSNPVETLSKASKTSTLKR